MRTTRCGTQSTVQNMSVVLGRRHRLLHVQALLARWNGGEQEIRQVHHGSPLDSELLYKERATPRAPLREEAGRSRVLHREFAQEEMQEETFLGYSRPVHPCNEKFRKNMIDMGRNEENVVRWTNWRTKTNTHHITPEEIQVYGNNWWIRSNMVSSDTMPLKHRADFKQALTTLRQLKNQEDQAYYHKVSKAWWDWQDSWWYSSSEHHTATMDPAPIDRGNLMDGDWVNYSGHDSQN